MNKAEFINAVAEKGNISKKDAQVAINTALDLITDTLAAGESINFVGFGTFEVKARAARMGHNPRTKESIEIPASKIPAFKAGKFLKDAISG